jgi:hypothetical protein
MDYIFSQLCAGASNELYANPRDCRKYFKCESSGASLQSCPANLIFDTKLKERSSKPVENSAATGLGVTNVCHWLDDVHCKMESSPWCKHLLANTLQFIVLTEIIWFDSVHFYRSKYFAFLEMILRHSDQE